MVSHKHQHIVHQASINSTKKQQHSSWRWQRRLNMTSFLLPYYIIILCIC